MNEFTEAQRNVIVELAGCYWDRHRLGSYVLDPDYRERHRNEYIEAITKGLTDPDYWGNNEA